MSLHRNLPTVSDQAVTDALGDARSGERDTLLSYVQLSPGMTTLDIQSAGGYLSDEIFRRLKGDVHCICVEPSDALRRRLRPEFRPVSDPVECFPSVGDASVDVALGLAGLHHSESHGDTLAEAFRVLRPGGQLAMCDVEHGSGLGDWLNDFVDRHNPAGHHGRFLHFGQTSRLLRDLGFMEAAEERRSVPWRFARAEQVPVFFKALFGLDIDTAAIRRGIDHHLRLSTVPDGVAVDWELIYVHARKPGAGGSD